MSANPAVMPTFRPPASVARKPPQSPRDHLAARRRAWLLDRLAEADGPTYDALVREVIEEFPPRPNDRKAECINGAASVRAVRDLLSDGLAVTEPDEAVWLTPAGWQAVERARGAVS